MPGSATEASTKDANVKGMMTNAPILHFPKCQQVCQVKGAMRSHHSRSRASGPADVTLAQGDEPVVQRQAEVHVGAEDVEARHEERCVEDLQEGVARLYAVAGEALAQVRASLAAETLNEPPAQVSTL